MRPLKKKAPPDLHTKIIPHFKKQDPAYCRASQLVQPELGFILERKTGFEPATPTLARLCSTPELLPHCLYWWRDPESNRGHMDFQSIALPSELSRLAVVILLAGPTRLELATFGVTGRHSKPTELRPRVITGGRSRVRTYDPLRVKQVFYR